MRGGVWWIHTVETSVAVLHRTNSGMIADAQTLSLCGQFVANLRKWRGISEQISGRVRQNFAVLISGSARTIFRMILINRDIDSDLCRFPRQ